MSSRLFQEIREKRGRVYSIYSFLASYKDVGYLGIYGGTSLEWTEEVVGLVLKEMERLAAGELGEEELQRAKSQLIGGMILGLESTDSWMGHISRNEIYFGKAISVEEISQAVRSVSLGDVIELARATFRRREEMVLCLLGNLKADLKIKGVGL
jgi:predicted Zn-dependent peptidase